MIGSPPETPVSVASIRVITPWYGVQIAPAQPSVCHALAVHGGVVVAFLALRLRGGEQREARGGGTEARLRP